MSKTRNNKSKVFYTPWQFYAVSCLGTPLAATWLGVVNYRVFRQPEKIRHLLVLGVTATIGLVGIAYLLPDVRWVRLWPFIYSIGIYYYARQLFAKTISIGIAEGMECNSWWRVFLIGFGFFLLFVAVLSASEMVFTKLFL